MKYGGIKKYKMNVNDYYKALKDETGKIFSSSLEKSNAQNITHDLISNLQVWYNILKNEDSSSMLLNSIEELDISCLQIMQGLHRGAFSSLRLSLEMLVGSIYFSAHNIEFKEWEKGSKDLIWASISCSENGILSTRFSEAYFPELKEHNAKNLTRVKLLYRSLSEMVHGNFSTWNYSTPSLSYNKEINDNYSRYIGDFSELSNYILSVRFLNFISTDALSELEPYLIEELQHISEIRTKIGGSL